MKQAFVVLCGLAFSSLGAKDARAAGEFDLHLRSPAEKLPSLPVDLPEGTTTGSYEQAVDHFAPNMTFAQRYWVNSQYASGPNAPVLYHMCGESNVDDAYFLNDNVLDWAQKLGARIVWLEHRYYGQSLPFADLTNPHMQFLTLKNIMEDLASFQKWLAASQGWTGKWIALGGSYSATMAALYRQAHPELVVGALAASAPMISGIGNATSNADVSGLSQTNPADSSERAWAYQACSEVGYWMAEGGERGAPLDLPSSALCGQVFGNAPYFDAKAYNAAYDAPFIAKVAGAPSNILFTYGSEDVWTDIGLATQQNANPAIEIRMIDGAGHHFDLNAASGADSAAVTAARDEFTTLAKKWLNQAQPNM